MLSRWKRLGILLSVPVVIVAGDMTSPAALEPGKRLCIHCGHPVGG